MSEFVKEYDFKKPPKEISYVDGEPLKLSNEYVFYHNKSSFRKELNRLQYLFKEYLQKPLTAAGIRDSYIKSELTNKYLIVLFTIIETVKETSDIIQKNAPLDITSGCYYLETTSKYMLLLARDKKGLTSGLDIMEGILRQTVEDYLSQKQFDDYIKIRPFKMNGCS